MRARPIIVFTDGASKRNPGPGGWGVIVATPDGHVTELGGGSSMTTNNKMELTGAIQALVHVRETPGPVALYTDSTYVIQGIREWVPNWRRRGWVTSTGNEVMNRDLWEALSALKDARGPRSIEWHYVRGHVGIPGNERVDAIADSFATRQPIELYDGPLAGYAVPILDVPDDTTVPKRPTTSSASASSSSGRAKGAPYSYLSLVDGAPMRHATWTDCEQRVRGRSGARFKKAMTVEDERAILRDWQVDPSDL